MGTPITNSPVALEASIAFRPHEFPADVATASECLGWLGCSAILVDPTGRIVALNRHAEAALPGQCEAGEYFPVQGNSSGREWSRALNRSVAGRPSIIQIAIDGTPTVVSITPCGTAMASQCSLVCFEKSALVTNEKLSFLAQNFQLTPTEQRIVLALMNGLVPKQIATLHNVTLYTVRTQIKHILTKVDMNSMTKLILYIARMPDTAEVSLVQ